MPRIFRAFYGRIGKSFVCGTVCLFGLACGSTDAGGPGGEGAAGGGANPGSAGVGTAGTTVSAGAGMANGGLGAGLIIDRGLSVISQPPNQRLG